MREERGRRRRVGLVWLLAAALGAAAALFGACELARRGAGAPGGPVSPEPGQRSGESAGASALPTGPAPRAAPLPPEKPGTVLAAAVQFASRLGEVEANRKGLLALAEEAARAGAKLIVLPEAAVTGYASTADVDLTWRRPGTAGSGPTLEGRAERVPGESTAAFGRVAKKHGAYIAVPLVERDAEGERYFNALVLVGPDGRIAAHYRKLNPWPRVEAGWCTPGDRGLAVVETPYGRVGLLVCYDIHSVLQRLAEAGVDIALHAVAWVDDGTPGQFERFLSGRARSCGLALVSANWTVRRVPRSWRGYGGTCVLARDGAILAKAGRDVGDEIVYARIPVRP